ncbi:MAG: efflux RND transporter periplasmic adaptor subunit [Gammaproteobacteria bacterium]|nr:efflux RND transporter periplasmic adaptor subunit [Gammaproteobacteria bacterium]
MSDDRTADLQNLSIDRSERPRSKWRILIWMILIAAIGGASYIGYFVYFIDDTLQVSSTLAVSAARGSQTESVLDATGFVVARRQASVSSKVPGKVTSVLIEEGMEVEEGQLLATLDDSINRAQLDLARSQLEATRSQLSELKLRYEQATIDSQRNERLAEQGLISANELEQSQLIRETLESAIRVSAENVAVGERTVELQEKYVSDMEIRAPFAGIVISKTAQPGEMIAPVAGGGGFTRTGICTIVDMDSLEVQIDVTESYINRVQPGQQVTVQLTAYPDFRMPAEVIAIIPTADRARSTVKVRVGFKQRDDRVLPDMAVKVSFLEEGEIAELQEVPTGVVVPMSAIDTEGGVSRVWVIKDNVVGSRRVRLGDEAENGNVQIIDGLRSGERVVTGLSPELKRGLVDGKTVTAI